MNFADFGLNPNITKAVTEAGFSQPTPIQAGTIQHTLAGKDVMACAPTGSGKTAAFVLPMLNRIIAGPSKARGVGPRVLILTPTRELSAQIETAIKLFSRHIRVRSGVVIGGVGYGDQYRLLAAPLDILVATPGRLIDHLDERRVELNRVELLVLDEADRMLDMGFLKPVERIINALPKASNPQGIGRPQTLLFSATFNPEIEKVAQRILQAPARVALAEARQSHADITQTVYQSDNAEHKLAQLRHLLEHGKIWQVIVFNATKHGADKLARKIQQWGHKTAALHGNLKQNQRKRVLASMHDGSLKVLVATDVAARGIDVKKLSHVINYDLPNVSEDYVHRIGRTGRAGETGLAISLVTPPDMPLLRDIEKLLRCTFKLETLAEVPSIMSEQEFRALNVPKTVRGGGGQQRRHFSGKPQAAAQGHGHPHAPKQRPASHFGNGPKAQANRQERGRGPGEHTPHRGFKKSGGPGHHQGSGRRPTRVGSKG